MLFACKWSKPKTQIRLLSEEYRHSEKLIIMVWNLLAEHLYRTWLLPHVKSFLSILSFQEWHQCARSGKKRNDSLLAAFTYCGLSRAFSKELLYKNKIGPVVLERLDIEILLIFVLWFCFQKHFAAEVRRFNAAIEELKRRPRRTRGFSSNAPVSLALFATNKHCHFSCLSITYISQSALEIYSNHYVFFSDSLFMQGSFGWLPWYSMETFLLSFVVFCYGLVIVLFNMWENLIIFLWNFGFYLFAFF